MVILQFIRDSLPYRAGDRYGVPDQSAEHYIQAGLARRVVPPAASTPEQDTIAPLATQEPDVSQATKVVRDMPGYRRKRGR